MKRNVFLVLLNLFLLVTVAEARPEPSRTKLSNAMKDLVREVGSAGQSIQKIGERASADAILEANRQIDLLVKSALREAQACSAMAAQAKRRLEEIDQKANQGIVAGVDPSRKELMEIVEKTERLSQEAGRTAIRVSGAASEVLQRATKSAKEAPSRILLELDGAAEDLRAYFEFLFNHPWRLDLSKSWKMMNGLTRRIDAITLGVAQPVVDSVRSLLAAMEGDVRTIHERRGEIKRLLSRSGSFFSERDGKNSRPRPAAGGSEGQPPAVSPEGAPLEPKEVLPRFNTEQLHRKLFLAQAREINDLEFSLREKLNEVERQFNKKRPTPPQHASDDPVPTPKVLK